MTIQYDGQVDLATGRSRKETSWKNRQMLWSELVQKFSNTHRTPETYADYLAAKRDRQDEIKDIGGFVGGYLTGGKRKVGNVQFRGLITLDLDFAKADFWDTFTMLYGHAAALYSTHKHSPETPRYRLILPLAEAVTPVQYQAIARRIAGSLDINLFDHTTFEPSRLMYWPSTSKDGAFEFEYQDGPWLTPDEILSTYHDWQDSSEWPVCARDSDMVRRQIKKQGDPLEKPGMVGAFCRVYSISEAIEKYLSEVYLPCDMPGRYTYAHGTTAAGLVTYEDKYAYSHHGTDPISGKLCNAFDLVRLHKFGLKDEDATAGTPTTKLPSYQAMVEMATKDKEVVKRLGMEKMGQAAEEFGGEAFDDEQSTEEDFEWIGQLAVDKKGNYLSTINNIVLIVKNDPRLRNRLMLNEFEGRLCILKDLPWRKLTPQTTDFTDDDADCLAHYLESKKMPFTYVQKALAAIRNEFKFHPVKEYLTGLRWDGVPRLDGLFIDFLGAEDSEYTRMVSRKTHVAAVARVFKPGTKFDTVLTFVGKEGIGKSTLIAKLAGKWFSDCLGDIHTKEGMESLRGVWIMEIAELATFRKADQEAIKRFISSTEDVYRPAYGRQLVRFPRQCIFFATTNKVDFLNSGHMNRRFWPVDTHITQPTKSIFTDLTQYEIDQIWAEAVKFYKEGEPLFLSQSLAEKAYEIRENHSEVDERQGLIEKYLNLLLPENWEHLSVYDRRSFISGDELQAPGTVLRDKVCVAEIWCELFGGMQRDMGTHNTKYIHDIMKRVKGWELSKSGKRFKHYGVQRAYIKTGKTIKSNVNTNLEQRLQL